MATPVRASSTSFAPSSTDTSIGVCSSAACSCVRPLGGTRA
jgi:hypothetical protein